MLLRRRNESSSPQPYVVPVSGKFDGNDGSWSTFMINVGDPGQNFRVLASTASSTTIVPLPEGCNSADPDDCPDRRGVESFGGAKSSGYQATQSNSSKLIGLYEMQLGSLDVNTSYSDRFSNHSAKYFYDSVGLGPFSTESLMISPEVVAGVADKEFFLGAFGLSLNPNNFGSGALPTFLSLLPNSTYRPIPSLSYGYTAGASYRNNSPGSLVLGGFDQSRFSSPQITYPITSGNNNTLGIAVQSITIDINENSLSATLDTNNFAHTFSASIDSTLPYLWLSRSVCDRFEQIFGLTYDNSTDLYLVNSTSRQRNQDSKISFKLAASQTSNDYNIITLPYTAFDLNASWPIYESSTNYFPIRRAPNGVFTLGRTFLQESYLTVDYERKNFSLAQATFSGNNQDIVAITKVNGSKSSTLSTGALAGIIIGSVMILLLFVVLVIWLLHRRKRADRMSLKSTSREPSHVPQSGTWIWQQAESSNGNNMSHEWRDIHSLSDQRRDTISPVAFSPMIASAPSSSNEWPLANHHELPATEAQQHWTNVSELPSTESSSGQSTEVRDMSQESTYVQPARAEMEKNPLGRDTVFPRLSEMSCDTQIHELESPIDSNYGKFGAFR